MNRIRAKVVCVLRHAGRTLLIRATDPEGERSFLIPPGGGVEFGERLDDAVRREIEEEVGVRVCGARQLGCLENVFRFDGRDEHELVFVYEADCPRAPITERTEVEIVESNGVRLPARWYTPDEIEATGLPVYPDGLWSLVTP